jgi:phage-related protein
VETKRELFFFKNYFKDFYNKQRPKIKKRIIWTLKVIKEVDRISEVYFKHLEGSEGIYEIRVQVGSDIFRIFSFFDKNNLIIIGHGFQKKSQKILQGQLEMAEKIRKDYYYEEKQKSH